MTLIQIDGKLRQPSHLSVDECRVKVFNTNVHKVVEKGARLPAK
jgi:hypothetical protein